MTCWRYSVHWVQKQLEALAKQDCFWCWSASKTMNAQSHQKPYMSHARGDTPTTPQPSCPPQMDRSQSMSADNKIATGLFHFYLDKAAVLNDFPHSAVILDWTASIWRSEAYSCCLFCFVFLTHPNQIVCIIICFKRRNHWNSWENLHNYQLLRDRRERNNAWIIIIIMEICKAPTLRLKALNKHTHIMYIEMENVVNFFYYVYIDKC